MLHFIKIRKIKILFIITISSAFILGCIKYRYRVSKTLSSSNENPSRNLIDSISIFDYTQLYLQSDTLICNSFGSDPILLQTKKMESDERESTLKIYGLDKNIYFYKYEHSNQRISCLHDAIEVGGVYFNIDSLRINDFGNTCSDISILECFIYRTTSTFIVFNMNDLLYNSSSPKTEILLVKIDKGQVTFAQYLENLYPSTNKCFGDFNGDGNLDFAKIIKGKEIDTLVCYTLNSANGFTKIPNKYILLDRLDIYSWKIKQDGNFWF